VIRGVPHSRLLLLTPAGDARQRTLDLLGANSITSDRIEFISHQPREAYLRTYDRIDIGLDTFPYNGHVTSLDAFWMGVPVVTLVGQRAVSRAGLSQLSNLGLMDLAAFDEEQFVAIAMQMAADRDRLRALRRDLRPRMQQSPLTDPRRFARNIETAYRDAWRTWCATPYR
jgi:predicted O-linked N-acetylglucosamine transferase (SPINDLY family)